MQISQGQGLRAYLSSVFRAGASPQKAAFFYRSIGFGSSEILYGARALSRVRSVAQQRPPGGDPRPQHRAPVDGKEEEGRPV